MKDVSSDLEAVRAKNGLPALAGAAWKHGKLVAQGASGVRAIGQADKVTTADPWHLGSDTKAMTAVLVALYIDRGKLRFDETLSEVLGAGLDPGFAKVTLEQLLEHRGGMPANPPPEVQAAAWKDAADPGARGRMVLSILGKPPAQPPGQFVYSNMSFVTLGRALEIATGKPWEDLIQADLFGPLGMKGCGFGAPTGAVPHGHRGTGNSAIAVDPGPDADNPPAYSPAGRVYCPLEDWGKFLNVVLKGARGEPTFVQPATMKRLLTPPETDHDHERYAGGWLFAKRRWASGRTLMHSGSNTMWTATAWLAPEKDFVMAATANAFDVVAVDKGFEPLVAFAGDPGPS